MLVELARKMSKNPDALKGSRSPAVSVGRVPRGEAGPIRCIRLGGGEGMGGEEKNGRKTERSEIDVH